MSILKACLKHYVRGNLTNTNGKVADPKLRERILALARETKQPFGVAFAARRFNIAWITARAVLTEMMIEGSLAGTRTTQGMLYFLPGQLEKAVPA